MAKVIIGVQNGACFSIECPADIEVEIRDFDVPDDWDPDTCKVDEDGTPYNEMILEK